MEHTSSLFLRSLEVLDDNLLLSIGFSLDYSAIRHYYYLVVQLSGSERDAVPTRQPFNNENKQETVVADHIATLEEAGVLDASRLSDSARDTINSRLTEEQVKHLIDVKTKVLPCGTDKPWQPDQDGSIF